VNRAVGALLFTRPVDPQAVGQRRPSDYGVLAE